MSYYTLGAPAESFPKGRAAALKTLELDPDLPDAHGSLAQVELLYTWDFAAADREYRRAIQLTPKTARNHLSNSSFLAAMGRRNRIDQRREQDGSARPPVTLMNAAAARRYYNARHHTAAVAQSQQALEIDSTFSRARFWLGLSYEQLGRRLEAVRDLHQTVAYGAASRCTWARWATRMPWLAGVPKPWAWSPNWSGARTRATSLPTTSQRYMPAWGVPMRPSPGWSGRFRVGPTGSYSWTSTPGSIGSGPIPDSPTSSGGLVSHRQSRWPQRCEFRA